MSDSATIDHAIRFGAAHYPGKPMVIDPGQALTYAALDATTLELAAGLVDAGVGKGTRVGLIMPNGAEWVRIALALTRIGAVLVPLSTLLRPAELVAQLATASVQFLISVPDFRGRTHLSELGTGAIARPDLPALRRIWTVQELDTVTGGDAALRVARALAGAVRPSDPLVVIFTSGSSAAPKGVMHSHGSALGAVRSGLSARCIDSDTRLYLPMPFFWVGGLGAGVLSALLAGATLVTEPSPAPQATLQLLERERVTLFRGWPDQAEALARHAAAAGADLSALRAGSLQALLPLRLRSATAARARLFGMTESFGPYCGYSADTDMPASASE